MYIRHNISTRKWMQSALVVSMSISNIVFEQRNFSLLKVFSSNPYYTSLSDQDFLF